MPKTSKIFPHYREMIHPQRRLFAMQLLHDQIDLMVQKLENKCEEARVPVEGPLEDLLRDIANSYETLTNPVVIEDVLATDWLVPRLKEARWDGAQELTICIGSLAGKETPTTDQWTISSDDCLHDCLRAARSMLGATLGDIAEDGGVDAPLRIYPSNPKMRSLATFLFDQLEEDTEMYELDRLSMLVMLMQTGTIEHRDFAALKDETNQQIIDRLMEFYEAVDPGKKGQDRIGKLFAFKKGKRPGFLSSMSTNLPGIEKFFLQDVGDNQEYNVRFGREIVMGGDRIEIPRHSGGAAWDGLVGRPVTDIIDTPLTRALGANVVSVQEHENSEHVTIIIDQRMKDRPLCWPEGDQK